LLAMNSGQAPRYFSGGGPVTNVGDIHINMQGSNNEDMNVRRLASRLRREIRRGTVEGF
jgi:hypothetical protein